MNDPIKSLEKNISEVNRLIEIHKELAGNTRGRKHHVEVLNKSALVLLVACWEAFVEDLASSAFETMLAHAADHKVFPDDVLALASKKLKGSQDNRDVWRLAGDGWKTVLVDYKSDLFKEYIGKLNTPKPKQIDGLFSALIGIPNVSFKWKWHRIPPEKATEKLNTLIELRGSIAHRVAASQVVHKKTVIEYVKFIYRLAVISANRVRAFVYAKTKHKAWPSYRFGKVS